jgi:hypothetical protein
MEQRSVRGGFKYEQVLAFHQLRIRRNSRLVLCSKSALCGSEACLRISVRYPLSAGQAPPCRPCASATSPPATESDTPSYLRDRATRLLALERRTLKGDFARQSHSIGVPRMARSTATIA